MKTAGSIEDMRGTGTRVESFPGETEWRWHVQLRAERVVSPIRATVVALTTLSWALSPHPPGAVPWLAWDIVAAFWCYVAVDVFLVFRRPDWAARAPWGSAALDFVFIGMWLAATGGRESPFLLLIFLGVATAPLRLPLPWGLAATGAYAGLYALFDPPGNPATIGYVVLLGLVQCGWAAATYGAQRTNLRDALTGAFSREYALFRVRCLLAQGAFPFALGLLDLDGFKTVNDTYGHEAGDAILIQCTQVITRLIRPVDLLARYGGDEFLVVRPGMKAEDACQAAERLRTGIEQAAFRTQSQRKLVQLTASIGIAEAAPGCTATDLVTTADTGLYQAKCHRNRVVCAPGAAS